MKAKNYTRCDLAMMGISTYGLAISVWAVVSVYVLIRDRRAANK